MAKRIVLQRSGGSEVLQLQDVPVQQPGPGEVWLEQTAIGVNPLDVLQRKGGARCRCPAGWAWRAPGG